MSNKDIDKKKMTSKFMMVSSRKSMADVSFVLYDESKRLSMPHIKGSFNDWVLVPMEKEGDGIWTYSQPISEGTYEWGMVEPDGSEWGIWLPEKAGHRVNLVVTVSRAGRVDGSTSIRMPSNVVLEAEVSDDFKKKLKFLGLQLPKNINKIFT